MYTIIYDESAVSWTKDFRTNEHYLLYQLEYIKELWNHRGYLYLNQIYEYLGVPWSPYKLNVCFNRDIVDLKMEHVQTGDNVFEIRIN